MRLLPSQEGQRWRHGSRRRCCDCRYSHTAITASARWRHRPECAADALAARVCLLSLDIPEARSQAGKSDHLLAGSFPGMSPIGCAQQATTTRADTAEAEAAPGRRPAGCRACEREPGKRQTAAALCMCVDVVPGVAA